MTFASAGAYLLFPGRWSVQLHLWRVNRSTGAISPLDTAAAHQAEPWTVAVTADSRRAYVGYEGGAGGVGLFYLDPLAGTLTDSGHWKRQSTGDVINTVRLAGNDRYLLAVDPSFDMLLVHGIDAVTGELTDLQEISLPDSPRRFAVVTTATGL